MERAGKQGQPILSELFPAQGGPMASFQRDTDLVRAVGGHGSRKYDCPLVTKLDECTGATSGCVECSEKPIRCCKQ